MKITLKDGSVMEFEQEMSVLDVAKSISEGLARVATSARSRRRYCRSSYCT